MSPRKLRKKRAAGGPLRVAIDTGGTFTDCVWIENGHLRMLKVFSTPDDPARAIAKALKQIAPNIQITLLHGTTVGTNTVLERKGARVAFVTTAGFEDSIEIGRQNRPKLYDFFFDRIPPLVPAELRFGLRERMSVGGEILQTPQEQELAEVKGRVRASQAQAVAISFLFSFANATNELATAEALSALKLPLSISHELLPEFREYERANTVVMNAYLQPVVQKYLEGLRARTKKAKIFVMQSSGGLAALEAATREPVRTVLSGPAGGVVGAAAMARRSGYERIITFDMGGTSTDVSLVDGTPRPTSEGELAGLPVRIPTLDIHTVGAGGGSLARFDAGGALRVGPESAGAEPGPICYGRGEQPTVTDANLLLGRLRPEQFLGGEFRLDVERTRKITQRWLRENKSFLPAQEFAAGVVRVVNANMEKALRVVSIERGHDPREFTLVAFGGAGGLHACELAKSLGIPRVIVPVMPGALSAYGILMSDVVKDYSRTVLWRVEGVDAGLTRKLEAELVKLEGRARKDFRDEGWGRPERLGRSADLRYRGQGYELNVPIHPDGSFLEHFHREHQKRYGYSHPEKAIEIVTLRLKAVKVTREVSAKSEREPRTPSPRAQSGKVYFDGRFRNTEVWGRAGLAPAKRYSGPSIVTEYSATTVIPPGWRFRVDGAENLLIEREK